MIRWNIKTILFLFVYLPLCLLADMDPGPDSYELSKAPEWPKPYAETTSNNANQSCKRPDNYKSAINKLNENEDSESFLFDARQFIDLNLDGKCEVILLQKYTCGTSGCGTSVGIFEGDKIKFIGGSRLHFTLLEPYGGWLQMEGWGRSGMTRRTRSLFRFNGKEYAVFRTDTWDSEKQGKMMYQGTEYNKYYNE